MRRAQLQASFSFAYGWMDGSPILLLSSSWEERAKRKNNTKNPQSTKENTLSELLQGVSFKLTPDEGEKGGGEKGAAGLRTVSFSIIGHQMRNWE